MKTLLPSFLLVATFFIFNAQGGPAIIKDPDGYTNVRESDSPRSKVIDKVMDHQVFWYEPYGENGMCQVNYLKNPFTQSVGTFGYMHASRIISLKTLPQLRRISNDANQTLLANDTTKVTISKKNVGKIEYEGGEAAPASRLLSIRIDQGGQAFEIPPDKIKNIEFFDDSLRGYQGPKDVLYILVSRRSGGDVEGQYDVVWSVKNGKLLYFTGKAP